MMEINHFEVLRKLDGNQKVNGIIPTMTDNKIVVSHYFTESTYEDASGKKNKCYLVTKLGCDFLANKFTGEKGILFTAKYVKRFREMEDTIQKPMTTLEQIQLLAKGNTELDRKIETVKQDLQEFKMELPLLAVEMERITNAVHKKGVVALGGKDSVAYSDKSLRQKVYSDIYRELKRQFGLNTYKAIKRSNCDLAISIINEYVLPLVLQDEIQDMNSQIVMETA